jgi:signal transduction histidine kinase
MPVGSDREFNSLALHDLSCAILQRANRGGTTASFVADAAQYIFSRTGCSELEFRLRTGSHETRWRTYCRTGGDLVVEGPTPTAKSSENRLEEGTEHEMPDADAAAGVVRSGVGPATAAGADRTSTTASLPFRIGDHDRGVLDLAWSGEGARRPPPDTFLQRMADALGIALASHRAQNALQERVKELTCLYGLARAVARSERDLAAILGEVVALLPPAWQYPEAARARVVVDDRTYATPGYAEGVLSQAANIMVRGKIRGKVEVNYGDPRPPADEGPFLKEERALIEAVAGEIGSLLERRAVEEERAQLQDQLRHADRLATIGQLAAGVAHELNEPLGTILGFAQLCRKQSGLPEQTVADLDKIVAATLHAREVVRKLMFFARGRPPVREKVNLNQVVEEGLSLIESRAQRAEIKIHRQVEPDLPPILADPNQLHQVLVNLLVNAIQAMPDGGLLTVETYTEADRVVLAVEDQGIGMPPAVLERIFEPFFTTKEVGEGTGLGLPVVHGIVTSHGGTVRVTSKPHKGSRFEVYLPISGPRTPEGEW